MGTHETDSPKEDNPARPPPPSEPHFPNASCAKYGIGKLRVILFKFHMQWDSIETFWFSNPVHNEDKVNVHGEY